ncbi:hypothetical protein CR513_07271, partial [Mucuna pruriens]
MDCLLSSVMVDEARKGLRVYDSWVPETYVNVVKTLIAFEVQEWFETKDKVWEEFIKAKPSVIKRKTSQVRIYGLPNELYASDHASRLKGFNVMSSYATMTPKNACCSVYLMRFEKCLKASVPYRSSNKNSPLEL